MKRCTVPVDFPNSTTLLLIHLLLQVISRGPILVCGSLKAKVHTQYFSLLFDDDQITHIANQMNLYARLQPFRRANYQQFDANVDEVRSFLGIFVATGCVFSLNLADYWQTNTIFSQPSNVKGMSRNHYDPLCGQLHFTENSPTPTHGIPGYDNLYKIRAVFNTICSKGKTLYNPGQNISVDEAIMKF